MPVRTPGLTRHPDFRRLWFGSSLSLFGTMVGNGAVTYAAILVLDAEAWHIAVLAICTMSPGFLFGLVGGAIVDRRRKRPVMIACDIGRFLLLATIPLAYVLDVLTIAHLWAVAFLVATLSDCLFNPAYEACLPSLIGSERLIEANSKLTATASVAEVTGFSISGWAVQLLRAPGAVAIDAVSFLVSAFALWRIRAPEPLPAPPRAKPSLTREIREGITYVAGSPVLRSLAAGDAFLAVGTRMIGVAYLLWLNQEVGFSPGVLGMIFAVGGISSLVASLFTERITSRFHFGAVMVISVLLVPIGALCMPLTTSVGIVGVTLLVANQLITDPGWSVWEISKVSVRQSVTPEHLRGRANASMRFLEFAAALAGAGLAGAMGSFTGPRAILFLAAAIMALPALLVALSPMARMARPPLGELVEVTAATD